MNKILIYLMILISIILCFPSVLYLINNGTVDGFNSYYTYTLNGWENKTNGVISGILIISLLLIFGIIYFFIIRNEKQIFNSRKKIIVYISIISFIFMLILPYLSSDIYYYIGDSWLSSRYGENPYYTSVSELQEKGINDKILDNTGYWKATTSVYGPLWNVIAKILVTFSFGNITIALFIFKIASYLIHVLNSYLIYKITKSNKYMLIYALNPLVLMEFLSNVHNDIYLILFILLALYFLVRKNKMIITCFFLALSISIKYSTILLVPFVLIYCFRNMNIFKRILYCFIYGLGIIGVVILLYLPYYEDITIFTNMLVQGEKYSQSIPLFLMEKVHISIFIIFQSLCIPIFIVITVTNLLILLFKKKINLKDIMKKYNSIMLVFTFLVLTTFQKWYILWLLPTIIWQSKNMRKFIMYLTIVAFIPSLEYFIVGGDPYIIGMMYSIKMLIIAGTILLIEIIQNNDIYTKTLINKKRRNNVKFSLNRWK